MDPNADILPEEENSVSKESLLKWAEQIFDQYEKEISTYKDS